MQSPYSLLHGLVLLHSFVQDPQAQQTSYTKVQGPHDLYHKTGTQSSARPRGQASQFSPGPVWSAKPVKWSMAPGAWGPARGQKTIREPLTKEDNWAFSIFEKIGWNQVMLH